MSTTLTNHSNDKANSTRSGTSGVGQLKPPPSHTTTSFVPATEGRHPLVTHAFSQPSAEPQVTQSSDVDQLSTIRPVANSKRTLMTHSKDGKLLSEKKLRRLEKNRLSARECRRRKREATENLERQINILEAENLRLRLQMQIGKEAEESRMQEQEKLTQDINDLLKSGASEADIHETLEEFKEKHADYGKSRRSAIEFHLRNIERLLKPTQTTQVAMFAFEGGAHEGGEKRAATASPSTVPTVLSTEASVSPGSTSPDTDVAPSSKLNPKALFQYLVNYLEVTPEQASALKDSRHVATELDSCLAMALTVLKELQERLAQTGDDLEAEFNTVRSILTPTQAAQFLVWVASNRACMHMLNELWERVYPKGVGQSHKATTNQS